MQRNNNMKGSQTLLVKHQHQSHGSETQFMGDSLLILILIIFVVLCLLYSVVPLAWFGLYAVSEPISRRIGPSAVPHQPTLCSKVSKKAFICLYFSLKSVQSRSKRKQQEDVLV